MALMRRYWPAVFLALAACVPLWRALLLGEAIGPFDAIRHMGPWYGPAPSRPWDVLQADGVLQFYPWRYLVFDAWGKGQLPAWNPYELAGTPLLANSQSAAFYPPHILLGLLHIPTALAMSLLAWFHLFWAGLGTYFLARRIGSGRLGATCAGTGFALSPFMLAWTALPSVITTVSWIPWVLGLTLAIFQADGGRRQNRLGVCLTVSIAMMLLSGHLQYSAYGFLALLVTAGWLTVRPMQRGAWRAVVMTAFAAVLGGMLAAPQLLPVLEYGRHSHRSNVASEGGYQAYIGGAIPIGALQGLALPTALGNPAKDSSLGRGVNDYWLALSRRGADFAETAISVGPLLFILLFFTRRPTKSSASLLLVGAVGLLLALGTALNRLLYFFVPGWSATGSPGRALVLVVLTLCVLAGSAIDRVREEPIRRVGLIGAGAALVGLVLALAPFFGVQYASLFPAIPDLSTVIKSSLSSEAPGFLAVLVLSVGVLVVLRQFPHHKWVAPVGVVLVAWIGYAWQAVPTSATTLPAVMGSKTERYAFVNLPWQLLTPDLGTLPLMPPNTASYSGLHDLGGYDSLVDRDSVGVLKEIDGQDPAPDANGNMMFIKPQADPAKLAAAGVTEAWSPRPLPQFGQPFSEAQGLVKYRLSGRGRAYTPSGPATIQGEGYSDLRIQAVGPGPLTVKDRLMDGWTAEVDGARAEISGAPWRVVAIGPGPHTVVFRYSPPGLRTGLALAMAALLALALMLLGRKPQPQ